MGHVALQNQLFYGVLYFLVVGFTYFYTAIIFQPQKLPKISSVKAGLFHIRPGKQTEEYLQQTMRLVVFLGALFWVRSRSCRSAFRRDRHAIVGHWRHEPSHRCLRRHRNRQADRVSAHDARVRSCVNHLSTSALQHMSTCLVSSPRFTGCFVSGIVLA